MTDTDRVVWEYGTDEYHELGERVDGVTGHPACGADDGTAGEGDQWTWRLLFDRPEWFDAKGFDPCPDCFPENEKTYGESV